MNKKPKTCPKCGSPKIANIVYGLPAPNTRVWRDVEEEKVVLGGCIIEEGSPRWQCIKCDEGLGATSEWIRKNKLRE